MNEQNNEHWKEECAVYRMLENILLNGKIENADFVLSFVRIQSMYAIIYEYLYRVRSAVGLFLSWYLTKAATQICV